MIAEWYVLDEAATKLSAKLRRKVTVNDIIGVAFEREFNLCCILKTTLARVVSNQDEVSAEHLMADEIDDRIAQIKRVKTWEDFHGYIKGNLKGTRTQVLTGPEVFNLNGIFELQLTFGLCDQLLGLNKPNKISGWFVSKDNQLFQIQMVTITGAVDELVPSNQLPVQIILKRDAYRACLRTLEKAQIARSKKAIIDLARKEELTSRQAAKYLNLSEAMLRQSRSSKGTLRGIKPPVYKKVGWTIIYDKKDLDEWETNVELNTINQGVGVK